MERSKLRALLLFACVALCAGALAACGESDDHAASSASSVLDETLAATSKLDSARLSGRLRLDPDGLLSFGGPIVLKASGPFAAPASGAGPRFDMRLAAAIGGQTYGARASSNGRRAYLRLDGRDYVLGRLGSRAASRAAGGAARRGALAGLGLNPAAWIKDPQEKGTATVAGTDTIRIAGDLDVARLLADVAKLLDGGAGDGLLTPKLREQIAGSVKSAKVELWTGARDRILRQLTAAIDFTFDKGQSPLTGLDGGRVNLRLRLDGVNATSFEVATPKNARPLSRLLGDSGLGELLSGFGKGLAPGSRGGDGGAAFLRCIEAAGGDSVKVMGCASKLSGRWSPAPAP
jgi:hypothetical protein